MVRESPGIQGQRVSGRHTKRNFGLPFTSACDRIIKIKRGVDRCWCAWSSKPVIAVNSRLGGFDSHILPPESDRSLAKETVF